MKPTEAYIAHIMAPERQEFRARLNQEWEPKVGDWVWVIASEWTHPLDDFMMLVRDIDGVGADNVRALNNYRSMYPTGKAYEWLPSLSQLLGMVVAAGWSPEGLHHIPAWIPGEVKTGEEESWEMTAVKISSLAGDQEIECEASDQCETAAIAAASLLERLWEAE